MNGTALWAVLQEREQYEKQLKALQKIAQRSHEDAKALWEMLQKHMQLEELQGAIKMISHQSPIDAIALWEMLPGLWGRQSVKKVAS